MDDESIKLEYKLTRAELAVIHSRSPSWNRRISRILAVTLLFSGAMGIFAQEHLWRTGLLLTAGVEIWFAPQIVIWLSTVFPSLFSASFAIEVASDAKGIRILYPSAFKVAPSRLWWSRLSEIREDDFGITLLYDRNWDGLSIPWKAFEDIEQQAQFVNLPQLRQFGRKIAVFKILSAVLGS